MFNENTKIYENMTFSNEPGVYLEGEFGVRIENIVRSVKDEDGMIHFENLTKVLYEEELIDFEQLDERQLEYIKEYNKTVKKLHQ